MTVRPEPIGSDFNGQTFKSCWWEGGFIAERRGAARVRRSRLAECIPKVARRCGSSGPCC